MTNWIATNTTGSYCLKKVNHHLKITGHHICSKCPPPARRESRAEVWRHSPTAVRQPHESEQPTRCWCIVPVRQRQRYWYNTLAPESHSTPHGVVNHNDSLRRRMRCLVWIHDCKRLKFDFRISQRSIAKVLRLTKLPSFCDVAWQKLLKLANVSRNYPKK